MLPVFIKFIGRGSIQSTPLLAILELQKDGTLLKFWLKQPCLLRGREALEAARNLVVQAHLRWNSYSNELIASLLGWVVAFSNKPTFLSILVSCLPVDSSNLCWWVIAKAKKEAYGLEVLLSKIRKEYLTPLCSCFKM